MTGLSWKTNTTITLYSGCTTISGHTTPKCSKAHSVTRYNLFQRLYSFRSITLDSRIEHNWIISWIGDIEFGRELATILVFVDHRVAQPVELLVLLALDLKFLS